MQKFFGLRWRYTGRNFRPRRDHQGLTTVGWRSAYSTGNGKNLGYIDAGEPAEKALLMMQQNKFPLLIVTKNNQVIGTVDLENIMEFMMVINARNETPAK